MLLSREFSINHFQFVENLPKNIRLELDPDLSKQTESNDRKLAFFKEHKGKFHCKTELPKKLEESINAILSGKLFYTISCTKHDLL